MYSARHHQHHHRQHQHLGGDELALHPTLEGSPYVDVLDGGGGPKLPPVAVVPSLNLDKVSGHKGGEGGREGSESSRSNAKKLRSNADYDKYAKGKHSEYREMMERHNWEVRSLGFGVQGQRDDGEA